ncbi:hypothetical protein HOO65_010737 [Ceratocystis lukuohia]|uniref:CID domain-containing protein n=1 Tax=Ceratocystis lukuohia TaxID=2019550 RepID=A0ABR4MT53_9PEZI
MADYESTAGAEVAEDFRSALEDMTTVLRVEIMGLCQIARENTEFAVDIAQTLQSYILKAAPHRKLPALYVLDAIVKNVGTPYTLYLAPKLYSMFLESYATVDSNVRRKMEEMLRTWKQAVPGSIDTRPVFPLEVVQPIEDALMKASASAFQAQQKNMIGRPRVVHPRDTPSPHARIQSPFGPPPGSGGAFSAPPGKQSTPPPTYPSSIGPQANGNQSSVNYEALKNDVESLIQTLHLAGAKYPHDDTIPKKTQALLDLQGLFNKGGSINPDQLSLIKKQVDDLAAGVRANYADVVLSQHTPSVPVPPPAVPQITLDSLLGPGALATLLASRQTPAPVPSTPIPTQPAAMRNTPPVVPHANPVVPVMMQGTHTPPVVPASVPAPAPPAPAVSSVNSAMSLMQQLRRAGILPPPSGPSSSRSTPVPTPPAPHVAPIAPTTPQHYQQQRAPPILPSIIANALAAQRQQQPRTPIVEMGDIQLDSTSLKQDRQHLLFTMLEGLGKPCSQCGRRFKNDEDGRKKRVRHMDWHFQVHQRSVKAEKHGQHRSWYPDTKDWTISRETIDADIPEVTSTTNAAPKQPEIQYIPVPDPTEGVNTTCSICADKFVNKWLDSAQEWVWLDTMRVGNKAYHASCYNEAFRSRNTPEPVLGKRKAESPNHFMVEGKKWRAEVV